MWTHNANYLQPNRPGPEAPRSVLPQRSCENYSELPLELYENKKRKENTNYKLYIYEHN